MNKVISISLNGNAYQLEEPGYAALSAYLAHARTSLAENPDRAEIIADLEQAIADKLRRYLTTHKSVITEEEVGTVIAEMGPVDGDQGAHGTQAESASHGPKRLYRISEGEYIGGVANGLAAYFDLDVALVRIAFVILLLLTSGGGFFGYLLAWIFIPPARTQEERAKAAGLPFNAEELISQAKEKYARVDEARVEGMRQWKEWKKNRHEQHTGARYTRAPYHHGYAQHRPSMLWEFITLTIFVFLVWLGYHDVPVIHQFLDSVWNFLLRTTDAIVQFVNTH